MARLIRATFRVSLELMVEHKVGRRASAKSFDAIDILWTRLFLH
jgi:hypothetical protein